MEHDWYAEEQLDAITVGQLEELCKVTFDQRNKIDDISKQLKDEEKKLETLERKIMSVLDLFGKTSYKSAYANFYTSEVLQVTQPATPEAKQLFRAFLKEQNLEDMLSVNSNTLKSYVKAQREYYIEKKETPPPIPGLLEPVITRRLNMKREKGKV